MNVLLKKATIIDAASAFHESIQDVWIEDGVIRGIDAHIDPPPNTKIISSPNLHVSIGWMDPFAQCGEPGFEHKETLASLAQAAIAGGFTRVQTAPNTKPVIDQATQTEFILQRSRTLPAFILPMGAITRQTEGKELAEMYDMNQCGTLAFSDGWSPVQSAGLLIKALQYTCAFDGVIIQVPEDKTIAPHGLMHEGIVSTRLGLPGIPMLAEELMVARDIKLARYANARLHFTGISSPKSIAYIQRAKDSGAQVSCSIAPHHLFFCDEDLADYDTNLKVKPALRTAADRDALREAVMNNQIDCIASHHQPQDYDAKVLEFEYARYGMISLESTYGVISTAMPTLTESQKVSMLSTRARDIFRQPTPVIGVGQCAELTLFDPSIEYEFTKAHIRSRSHNSPYVGKKLQGKVMGVFSKGQWHIHD